MFPINNFHKPILVLLIFTCLSFCETVCILSGIVSDSMTGSSLSEATISTTTGNSPVLTDEKGSFKSVILATQPFTVTIAKAGYRSFSKLIDLKDKEINLAIVLVKETAITIGKPTIVPRCLVSGYISGIPPESIGKYKVVVYVLTDQWYIHPYATNTEGQGFAKIRKDGAWQLQTVWRGYQSYRIAILVLEKATFAPPKIPVTSAEPNQAILSQINSIANLIIDAPEGI